MVSVETTLVIDCWPAVSIAVVDFPTPVEPAIRISIGGLRVTLVLVVSAMEMLLAICLRIGFPLIKTFINGRGFEAVPLGLSNDERTNVDCWRVDRCRRWFDSRDN